MSKKKPKKKQIYVPSSSTSAVAAYMHRHYHLKHNYGMTHEDYDRMLAEHNGCCKICGATPEEAGVVYLDIDHCHETGQIRGLLCNPCNLAIGVGEDDPSKMAEVPRFKDNPEWIQAAIDYFQTGG